MNYNYHWEDLALGVKSKEKATTNPIRKTIAMSNLVSTVLPLGAMTVIERTKLSDRRNIDPYIRNHPRFLGIIEIIVKMDA